jgi:dTDP-4-dehydrorhamnose reductase
VECTVNRVGDAYFDQVELTGFGRRLDDLDRFARLGIAALRFPVLWERTAPRGLETADWSWADSRLERLRELGIRPIVGLVHHGSGPPGTSLLDPEFPQKLAVFARAVAERYPWLEDWTPVNEPLTTARFSGLYGFWYPHRRDARSFAQALLIECRAVVEAMRAVRDVIPSARLVQTDDLGKTHSTEPLRYQAEHENERRWLTWDLLCGRRSGVDWWLDWIGVDEAERRWFEDNPCPPDVVGINHYLSSERFLDHRLDRYPEHLHGSNGKDAYVDELAARILGRGPDGPAKLLLETWERYRLPIAVTEAHNGCTREEQLRWLREVWDGALAAREAGADVRAVTLWSLLGAVGWDKLVTAGDGRYEPGVFDAGGPEPRPTAIARMATSLARDESFDEPLVRLPGWWRRRERLWYPPEGECTDVDPDETGVPPLLVTGRTGTLGAAFARLCELRGIPYRLLSRAELDIAEPAMVERVLGELRPWAVVNTAGYVRVDEAERDETRCRRENADGPAILAAGCAAHDVRLLTFSSDLVFGGEKRDPYVEPDPVAPLSVYGRTKAEGERRVLDADPAALVIRTSALFGPWDEHNFVTIALRRLDRGLPFRAAADAVVSPTYVPDLVNASLDLLIDGERGIWHLANDGELTWARLAHDAAQAAGVSTRTLQEVPTEALELSAPRPMFSALGSERGGSLAPLADALARYLAEREAA